MTVTVQAGARVRELVEALRPHGLTLMNYASIREQQIGGFTQVSAHGTGARQGMPIRFPDCSLILCRCICVRSPHPPPLTGHSFPVCLHIVHQRIRVYSPRPLPWPGYLPPPWPGHNAQTVRQRVARP